MFPLLSPQSPVLAPPSRCPHSVLPSDRHMGLSHSGTFFTCEDHVSSQLHWTVAISVGVGLGLPGI